MRYGILRNSRRLERSSSNTSERYMFKAYVRIRVLSLIPEYAEDWTGSLRYTLRAVVIYGTVIWMFESIQCPLPRLSRTSAD